MKTDKLLLLSICFFLSGLAGLVYQTAWTQQLALVFGTSELALATVLGAYMGGLALGASLAGRWMGRVRRPVLVYGLLELGIGAAALLVPAGIAAAGRLQVALLGAAELPADDVSAALALFYLTSSFAILLVPTALMGATLPLLARHAVRRDAEIGPRIGLLYTVNTLGAAAGTLATAFLLLPRIGLGATIWVAAAVNVLVFAAAVLLARRDPVAVTDTREQATSRPQGLSGREADGAGSWILPAVLVSGAVSFSWEILWTRLLSPLLGGSVYAFATMLASFLVALSLGSALAARLASSRERARRGFAIAQLLIAGLSLAAFAATDRLPALVYGGAEAPADGMAPGSTVLAANFGVASLLSALVLLPGGVAIGATFPLAVRVLARGAGDAAAASARVFAWNTVGAIAGALATGYFLLPVLRFSGMATAAATVSLLLAAATALGVRPRRPVLGAIALAALLALGVRRPPTPWEMLRYSPMGARAAPGETVYYGVGRGATVLLTRSRGEWRLSTNGLPESSIEDPGYRPGRHVVARWLALLPLALRPETSSLVVVGLGAGVTVEDLPASVEEIHVVELEPEVVAANRWVATVRRRDPLADPRLSLHIADARGALRLTRRRFGALVSQPSHPWTSGASNLYTREFFALARDRLEPAGVFVQWMGLHFVDEALLRSLVATAADVFKHVEVYQPLPGAVLIAGSARPFDLTASAGQALADGRGQWRELGVLCREDLIAARLLDDAGVRRFAHGAALITDARNLLRMRSPGVMRRRTAVAAAKDLTAPFEPPAADLTDVDFTYLVRRWIRVGAVQRARRLAETLADPAARQTSVALTDLAKGHRQRAERSLRRVLQLDAGNLEARAALLELSKPSISSGPLFVTDESLVPAEIVEGWRLSAAGDWRGVRRLEERLAALGPRHPLFDAATRLRARWRLESGDLVLGREALDLLLPLFGPLPRPQDLMLRARLGAAIHEPRIALAAISEVLPQVSGAAPLTELARDARRLLESLPADDGTEAWRQQLLQSAEHR